MVALFGGGMGGVVFAGGSARLGQALRVHSLAVLPAPSASVRRVAMWS